MKSTLKNGSFLMTHTIIDRSDVTSWMRRSIQPLFVHIKCSGRTHSPIRRKSGKETSTVWLQGLDVKIILFWDSGLRKAFRNLLQSGYATNVDPGSEACKAYIPACTSPLNTIPKKFFVAIDLTKHFANFWEVDLTSPLSAPQRCRVPLRHERTSIISGKRTVVHFTAVGLISAETGHVEKAMMRAQTPEEVRAHIVSGSEGT